MRPPTTLNVLDKHNGFTALTLSPTHVKIVKDPVDGEREARPSDYRPTLIPLFVRWDKVMRERDTLWRPGSLLKNPVGQLEEFDERSFYQLNENVTKAIYKCKGYRFRVVVWFDNETGERIA